MPFMKFKYAIWIVSIIISVSVISGCGNGKEVKNIESKIKLLDLGSVPVYSGEIPPLTEDPDVKEPVNQASEKTTEKIYRDDFNSFDPAFWTVIEEKTNNLVPEKAGIDNGNLVIEATVTDRNPFSSQNQYLYPRVIQLPLKEGFLSILETDMRIFLSVLRQLQMINSLYRGNKVTEYMFCSVSRFSV